jgi:hypothetical protein
MLESTILWGENGSHTYKEEYYIRGLFESHDEIDVAFKEMKIRNFDPYGISKMARKMMFEQLADKKNPQAIIIDEVSMMYLIHHEPPPGYDLTYLQIQHHFSVDNFDPEKRV